jgi:hypothetical protein
MIIFTMFFTCRFHRIYKILEKVESILNPKIKIKNIKCSEKHFGFQIRVVQPGEVVYAFNPATGEVEAGGLRV